MVTLDLVVRLFEFHTPAFQFNLHQRQTVYKNGHIVAALFTAFHRDLVGNLKLVLAPLLTVEELHPDAFAVHRVKRIKATELLRLFKACASFKVNEYLVKLLIRKFGTAMLCQPLTVVYLQLPFEIGLKILLFGNLDIFIVHLLERGDKSGFQCCFTLY